MPEGLHLLISSHPSLPELWSPGKRLLGHQRHGHSSSRRTFRKSLMDVSAHPMPTPQHPGLTLLSLPNDCLLATLQSSGLCARDLCHLEQTCHAIHSIVDEEVWKAAFLQHRRRNALHDPQSWKQEYARRDSWSRTWRQFITCANMSSSQYRFNNHASKLRRFALKMISGAPLARSSLHISHLVSSQRAACGEPGIFPTISTALAKAKAFDILLIEPGNYNEKLRLDKPIELIGVGGNSRAIVASSDGPAIEISSRIACRVSGLHIQQHARGDGGPMSGAVLVKGGALLILEECVVSSETGHCVVMQGTDSCGYILHNDVHHGKGVGVLVCDNAKVRAPRSLKSTQASDVYRRQHRCRLRARPTRFALVYSIASRSKPSSVCAKPR